MQSYGLMERTGYDQSVDKMTKQPSLNWYHKKIRTVSIQHANGCAQAKILPPNIPTLGLLYPSTCAYHDLPRDLLCLLGWKEVRQNIEGNHVRLMPLALRGSSSSLLRTFNNKKDCVD